MHLLVVTDVSWNDQVRCVIVKSGTWKFYEHDNHTGQSTQDVLPGGYSNVGQAPQFAPVGGNNHYHPTM
jgi:Beta/Gamma crystallin